MKFLFVCVTFMAVAYTVTGDESTSTAKSCYAHINQVCTKENEKNSKVPQTDQDMSIIKDVCSGKYGAITKLLPDLQQYVFSHIISNFEYMLMATNYGTYQKSREGFEKLFMDLSDSKWNSAIDLIKYITKRGEEMDFKKIETSEHKTGTYQLHELQGMAKALDMEKELAKTAFQIHRKASRREDELHDPETSSYIENEFAHKQAETIRKLSGHTSDLTSLLNNKDGSLALYIFDDYLKKHSIV